MSIIEPIKSVWTDFYSVHSWETDIQGKVKFPFLCNYMQESAWRHAENLGLGFSQLIKKDLVWVLARQMIRMEKYPHWEDTIRIDTWPTGSDRLFFFRDFKISNKNGELLGTGTTTWFVIDIKSRRPQKPDKFLELEIKNKRPAISDRSCKLESLSEIDNSKTAEAGYYDLDVNKHVTNIRYISWILESYSHDFLNSHRLKELTINHLAEAQSGDSISINTKTLDNIKHDHSITLAKDNKELCRAQILWAK
jgi:medium-chain acyl-[acyl-carrier-protein] hydrolase